LKTRDPRFEPSSVGPTEDEARLRIQWGDGQVSEFRPLDLRLLCPCAGCVDEITGVRTLRPEAVNASVYPTAIHYVGRYALQFMWSDGHSTGIYTFEYLRQLGDRASEA
jgi:ATP-binding protein involved in chromosome partitioning